MAQVISPNSISLITLFLEKLLKGSLPLFGVHAFSILSTFFSRTIMWRRNGYGYGHILSPYFQERMYINLSVTC